MVHSNIVFFLIEIHLQIVITAGEFDAIAVHQATSLPAVALPSGTTSLPPEVCIGIYSQESSHLSTKNCSLIKL